MSTTAPRRTVRRAAGLRSLVLISAWLCAGCASRPLPEPGAPPAATAQDTITLVLMGTTDVHGRVYPHDYYTGRATDHGLALLKPLIDSIRTAHPGRSLLFDSGDLLQGNPLPLVYAKVYPSQPNPIIRAMNLLAYDASAIGNHEFNYGLPHLARAIEQASFPFVAANIFRAGTQTHAYQPSVLIPVVVRAGDTLRVGVTGNTPPGVHLWDRDHVQGVLDFRDVVASVRATVRELRTRGADVVVVLSHGGLEGTSYDTVTTRLPPENASAELARQVPEIDVIFLGHTHRELADTTISGVLLTQARNWGASLAVATLHARRKATGPGWSVATKRAAVVRPHADVADRTFMDSVRWEHERTVEYVNTRIGRAAVGMSAREARVRDTPIIDFINEVQRRAAGADLSATAAFRLDAELPAGELTIAHVAALYPYDNTLRAIRITGAQLRAYLEKSAVYYRGWPSSGGTVTNFNVPGYNFDIISGVDYTIDVTRPVGQRITSLTRNGAPVRDSDSFTLALNNYRQSGGGGYDMIAGAPIVYDRQQDVRELLIEEVRRRGELRADADFRESWRLVPAEAATAALTEQTTREPATPRAAAPRKRLRVVMTNDFHGNLAPVRPTWSEGRDVGGAAALTTYFRHEHSGFDGATVLLDGGDVMQGTPISTLMRGRTTVEFFNTAGYAGAAIGNHEFDWGPDTLRVRMAEARFPWLSANILVTGTDTTPSWLRGTAVIERAGIRIGLIGLTTQETPQATMADYVAGLTFEDGAAIMNRRIPELRAQGVDFVIVVAHAGASCTEQTTQCHGEMIDWLRRVEQRPDLVVAGHTHQVVRTWENGVPVIEAATAGQRYGVVDLERVSADSVDVWIRGTPVPWVDRVVPDSAVLAFVARAEAEVGPRLNERVTEAAENILREGVEWPLGRLIADAQRHVTRSQIVFMNRGGVRTHIDAGEVTWGDLFRVHPFGNTLIELRLRGADVRAALEHALRDVNGASAFISGATVRWDPARPPGQRVLSVQLASGESLRDDAIYSVTVNEFLATGVGDGFTPFGRALERRATGIVDLDALITYIRTLPQPIRAPPDVRLIPTPSAR